MKKNIGVLSCILVCFLLHTNCSAHEKVVVIPLGSSNIVGVYTEPYQYFTQQMKEISIPGNHGIEIYSEVVPEGKRLFIHNLSLKIEGLDIYNNPICNVSVKQSPHNVSVRYPFLMTPTPSGTIEFFVGTPPIMIFADPGERVMLYCSVGTNDNLHIVFAITGYYVNK